MKRYLGLAQTPTGLRGCLIEEAARYMEPRPLYLNLTGGASLQAPLNYTLDILEWSPHLAWATPRPAGLPPYHPEAEPRRAKIRELELPPREIDTILRIADRLQGRAYHRAHLAAWLTLRDSQGEWLGRAAEEMARDWLYHLARIRTTPPSR